MLHNWNMSQEVDKHARTLLAENVKFLREKAGLDKEELALNLGLDNSYISKVENSKMNVTIDKIQKLATFFKVDVKLLFK